MKNLEDLKNTVPPLHCPPLRQRRRIFERILDVSKGIWRAGFFGGSCIVLDRLGYLLSIEKRERWHNFVYRLYYAVLPPGLLKRNVLRSQKYLHLRPTSLTEQAIRKVLPVAQKIYGERWSDYNAYSDALLNECVSTLDKVITTLCTRRDRINYLEIGSAQGVSMAIVGAMLQRLDALGTAVSIDPYFEDGYDEEGMSVTINKKTKENALHLYKSLGLNVRVLERTSYEGLVQLLREQARFDLIYIDGFHSGLTPTIDFSLAYNLLNKNGMIMLDDHVWPDVASIKKLCDRHLQKITECWKTAAYQVGSEEPGPRLLVNGTLFK
jgi:predicted O-methyltransferase YrrM